MFILISILWVIRTSKTILFYLYLWQLKEYHIPRFIDHFRTEKGKRLFLNKIFFFKIIVLIPFIMLLMSEKYLGRTLFLNAIIAVILLIYLGESFSGFKNLFKKDFKKPILTKKAYLLISSGLIIEILILVFLSVYLKNIYSFSFGLLVFDILMPLIATIIVLVFQPIAILLRNQMLLNKAREKRISHKNLKVIGITGSYGKTGVKEILTVILSEKFKVLKTEKHQNSEAGISQCILNNLKLEHQIFIAEMGAYGQGGIKLLAGIAKPEIGILTGINQQHLALFGSQAKIIKTKYELIESLPKNGLAVFNGDNKYCLDLYNMTGISKRMYKTEKTPVEEKLKPDVWAENIKVEKDNVSFKIYTKKGESQDFQVNLLGEQNVSNILGSIIVAKELGMSLNEISQACSKIKPEQGSMRLIKDKDDPYIIDSSYSANPNGVLADLNYLNIWPSKKAIIMPCLIELGKESKKIHKKIGEKIGQFCDLAIITTKERFNEVKQGAVKSGMDPNNILFIEDPEEIIRQINIFSSQGDAVLIEGRIPKKVIKFLIE